jgi:thiamine-phosphate pyrophosphorylase
MGSVFRRDKLDWSVYAIIDREWLRDRAVREVAEAVIRGGAGILQYRDKRSGSGDIFIAVRALLEVTRRYSVPLIVNDRVDIAMAAGADGVHVGPDDLPVERVRNLAGSKMIVGVSVQSERDFSEIRHADYLGAGAVFPTTTHAAYPVSGPDLIRAVRSCTGKPVVGIGGITLDNCAEVIRAGADGVALISGILAADDPEEATRRFKEAVVLSRKIPGKSH